MFGLKFYLIFSEIPSLIIPSIILIPVKPQLRKTYDRKMTQNVKVNTSFSSSLLKTDDFLPPEDVTCCTLNSMCD